MKRILTIAFISLGLWGWTLAQDNGNSNAAIQKGKAHFAANYRAYGLTDPDTDLKLRSAKPGTGGMTHLRYDQFYKGVPVFEGEAIAHVDASGEVSITDSLHGNLNLDVRPNLPAGAAMAIVRRALDLRGPVPDPEVTLQILPRGERVGIDMLVWHVAIFYENEADGTGSYDIFVDAASGMPVWGFDSLETSATTGTGKTMFLGDKSINLDLSSGKYYMRDVNKASSKTTDMLSLPFGSGTIFSSSSNIFGNNRPDLSNRATAGADAHFGMVATWDYFKTKFGRNGIDGKGRSTYSRVHYSRNYENAFWTNSCFCMTYGDGASTFYPLVALDVAGHEMAHGVMSTEANLTYSGQSGGLNESSSDIFGTMVELFVNDNNDGTANRDDTPDYWIGERIYKSNWSTGNYVQTKALRYMDDPAKDGSSPACYSSTIGSLNVHYSSGPNNHMFYLLAAGGTSKCNGAVVTGIGPAKAEAIWYDAIANWMTASTNYAGARQACLNAAAKLYGQGSPEYIAVGAAYTAINVP